MKNGNVKKSNSYKKLGLYMLASAIGGGILGVFSFVILDGNIGGIETGVSSVLEGIRGIMVPALAAITLVSVVYGEINLRKQKMICGKVLETEDEECDGWEYEGEKTGAYGTVANLVSQVLCILVLSVGYSVKYIGEGNNVNMLGACAVFLVCYAYDGFWQVRYVKTVQTAYPEKIGDPSSRKFHEQWLESCDEAEKEVIYRSAYKSYIQTSKAIPILLVLVMLGHLFFNTGIMAIVMVAVIWMVVTISYLSSCVRLKGQKIRE